MTLYTTLYLLTGFIIGFIGVRLGRCEEPVETWAFMTLFGPLILLAAVGALIVLGPFWLLVRLLGIEED
jgi:uncharacterized membrane protein YedE/YeeE